MIKFIKSQIALKYSRFGHCKFANPSIKLITFRGFHLVRLFPHGFNSNLQKLQPWMRCWWSFLRFLPSRSTFVRKPRKRRESRPPTSRPSSTPIRTTEKGTTSKIKSRTFWKSHRIVEKTSLIYPYLTYSYLCPSESISLIWLS